MISTNHLSIYYRDQRVPTFYDCHYIHEDHSSSHSRLPHIHQNYLELYYVYKGSGKYLVDGQNYEVNAGDLVICNAGVLHGENPEDYRSIRSYCIGITNVAIVGVNEDNRISNPDVCPIVQCGEFSRQIGEIYKLIYALSDESSANIEILNMLTNSVLLMVLKLLRSGHKSNASRSRTSAAATADRIRVYLEENYRNAVTLDDIASALHLNKYYLSHVFKEEFGVSPIQYAMKRRIGEAQSMLMDSSKSIADIADELGFSSVCHLNSMFSQYVGLPPGKYRSSFHHMKE